MLSEALGGLHIYSTISIHVSIQKFRHLKCAMLIFKYLLYAKYPQSHKNRFE